MKKKLFFLAALFIILIGCEKEQIEDAAQSEILLETSEIIYVENEYLVFPNKDVFDKVLNMLNQFDDEMKYNWGQALNFVSAHSVYTEAENEIMESINCEVYDISSIKNKYRDQLLITDDDMDYYFYARKLQDILNPKGEVKIGRSLYKFTADKEYIILDGDYSKLQKIESNQKKSANGFTDPSIFVFDAKGISNKKNSSQTIIDDEKTVGRYRLIYESYAITFLEGFYNWNSLEWWSSYGYEWNLDVLSKKRSFFWFNYGTTFHFDDHSVDYTLNGNNTSYTIADGQSSSGVTHLIFTHLEWSHSGWYEEFPNHTEPTLTVNHYNVLLYTKEIDSSDGVEIDYDN